MKHALALKYQNFLSRRKFTLVCKTQASYFNTEKEVWLPKNIKCLGLDLRHPQPVSSNAVDLFVKNLNIGHVEQIPAHLEFPGQSLAWYLWLLICIFEYNISLKSLFGLMKWKITSYSSFRTMVHQRQVI